MGRKETLADLLLLSSGKNCQLTLDNFAVLDNITMCDRVVGSLKAYKELNSKRLSGIAELKHPTLYMGSESMKKIAIILLSTVVITICGSTVIAKPSKICPANGKLKIFILSGQSNMVGFGQLVGSPGTMETYLKSNPKDYGHLVDGNSKHVVRDDVWIVNLSYKGKEQMGWLTTGYGASPDHIGPEYAFGFVVGDYFEDPVLIIKSAWGGRSLYKNFLSPSSADYPTPKADGDTGFQYSEILRHVKEITGNLKKHYPSYSDKGYEIVGFGWHQGWNDRINQQAVDVYEKNMEYFMKDIRKDLGIEKLPFVIANTGMGGWDIPPTARYKKGSKN